MITFEEALRGSKAYPEIVKGLQLLSVEHFGYDGKVHTGQLVVPIIAAIEIREIFETLFLFSVPIEKIIPISKYNWDDNASMADNNTSAFNFRTIDDGTNRLSPHSCVDYVAIDINPFTNPCVIGNNNFPTNAKYKPEAKGAIYEEGVILSVFEDKGWTWGGRFESISDYQHFEKRLSSFK
ncbi:M15 family metallopeptidase [Candidatus Nomurabacteria bacterium]|nr:M15 family metallopeptidase [Candidatus Kaiserbacteria bacterium]MCB9815343.1 M15 family metallopeptidase [Candidatus Nomurabacteria bacterium]MCB9819565.1 M15 family metallopeptidase [Candidatus Nomurabacteria bacterium]